MLEILEALLDHGADPNGDSKSRPSEILPIRHAVSLSGEGLDAPLEMLLARGADPNAVGPHSINEKVPRPTGTALIHQVYSGAHRDSAVRILRAHGADPNIKDSDGCTAADYCRGSPYVSMKQMLTAATAKSKTTVHFFCGNEEPNDGKALQRMAKEISGQPMLSDSSLFIYHLHPWPEAIQERAGGFDSRSRAVSSRKRGRLS